MTTAMRKPFAYLSEMRQSFPYLSDMEFYGAAGWLLETRGEVYAKDIPDAVRELAQRDAVSRRSAGPSPARGGEPGRFTGRSRAAQRLSTRLRAAFQVDREAFHAVAPDADANAVVTYWFTGALTGAARPTGFDVIERLVRSYVLLSGGQWMDDMLIRAACARGRVTAAMLPTLRPIGVVREVQMAPSVRGGLRLLTHQMRFSVVCVTGEPTRREWLDAWQAARQISRQRHGPGRRPDAQRDERLLSAIATIAGPAGPPASAAIAFWESVTRAVDRDLTANAARLWWRRRGHRLHAAARTRDAGATGRRS